MNHSSLVSPCMCVIGNQSTIREPNKMFRVTCNGRMLHPQKRGGVEMAGLLVTSCYRKGGKLHQTSPP